MRTTIKRRKGITTLTGNNFEIVIDEQKCEIARYVWHGEEILRGMHINLWRPPTQNDHVDPNGALAWEGLEKLRVESLELSVIDLTADTKRYAAAEVVMEYLLKTEDSEAMPVREIVEVSDDGAMQVSVRLQGNGAFRTFARVGLQSKLSAQFRNVAFAGFDAERYPDRRTAGRNGVWHGDDWRKLTKRHAIPQEEGNREAYKLFLIDKYQESSMVISINDSSIFNFSLHEYEDSIVAAYDRWWKMPEPDCTYSILKIDSRLAGVGTATCGPGVREPYRLSGDSTYTFRFTFTPFEWRFFLTDTMPCGDPFRRNSIIDNPLPSTRTSCNVESIESSHIPEEQYGKEYPSVLFDGKRAVPNDYTDGWTGWSGVDTLVLTATTTLQNISEVSVGCCHAPDDWVLLPEKVEIWFPDMKAWVKCNRSSVRDERHGRQRVVYNCQPKHKSRQHRVKNDTLSREVKIRIIHPSTLPDWHAYKGEKAWLMIDEVKVR